MISTLGLYFIAGSIAFVGAFGLGYRTASNKAAAAQLAQQVAAEIAYHNKEGELAVVAEQLEEAKRVQTIRTKIITQQVNKIVERPIYRNVCLDHDGLSVANRALTNTTENASEPTPALPKPDTP